MSNSILKALTDTAKSRADIDPSHFIVRALWKNQYVMQISPGESLFNLHYLIVQTENQGSCYFGGDIIINEDMIGQNLLQFPVTDESIMIAYLDAVFAAIIGRPDRETVIDGSNILKADLRAKIVCDEVLEVLKQKTPKNGDKHTVVNVGTVAGFLSILSKNENINMKACDFYPKIVGKTIHGVLIENGTNPGSSIVGDHTLELIGSSDLALVTGMTLATNTLNDIIKTAQENNTALIVFAETGANFAEEYCKMGVDSVISEPHPYYMICDGPTKIKIYRK